MKLSKQERIGVLIIAVVLILVLGTIFFVVPKVKEVRQSKVNLDNTRIEYQAAVDKAAGKDELKTKIIEAYNNGRGLADMFFTEMTPYELDNEVRAFVEYCKSEGISLVVEDMVVNPATVEPLSVSFFTEAPGAQYDLKVFATQGVTATEEEQAAASRRATLMSKLGAVQNVAASKASFEITVLTPEDYIKFIDIVNNYEKTENGKKIRKALAVNGLNLSYDDIIAEYDALVDELEADALDDANDIFKEYAEKMGFEADIKENTANAAGGDANTPAAGDDKEDDEEEKKTIEVCIYSASITLTFYCVERMPDPTELLDAQDAA